MPSRLITRIAPDVGWLPVSFANVYFIGRPGGKWVLVDAGLPGWAAEIFTAAEARFGSGSRPEAKSGGRGERDADDLVEHVAVAMPADAGAGIVAGEQDMHEILRFHTGESGRLL